MTNKNDSKYGENRFLNQAFAHQQQGRWAEALEAFVAALEIAPHDADLHYHCGYALEKLSEKDAALKQYQEVLSIDPKHVKTLWRLAMEAGRQKLDENAVTLYQEIIKVDENHIGAHLNLAEALESMQQYDQAIIQFKRF